MNRLIWHGLPHLFLASICFWWRVKNHLPVTSSSGFLDYATFGWLCLFMDIFWRIWILDLISSGLTWVFSSCLLEMFLVDKFIQRVPTSHLCFSVKSMTPYLWGIELETLFLQNWTWDLISPWTHTSIIFLSHEASCVYTYIYVCNVHVILLLYWCLTDQIYYL